MIKFTIANKKGGSTKTTTAVHFAHGLIRRGYRVLFVDNDAQGNSVEWLGGKQPEKGTLNIVDLMTDDGVAWEEIIDDTPTPGLSLIASSSDMDQVDEVIMRIILEGGARQFPAGYRLEQLLQRRLPQLPDRWDFMVIDTPPSMNLVTRNSLLISDYIILAVDVSPMTLQGTGAMKAYLDELSTAFGRPIPLLGALATMVEKNTLNLVNLNQLHTFFKEKLFGTKVRRSVRLKEASQLHQTAYHYAPTEPSTYDYDCFVEEALERLKTHGVTLPQATLPIVPRIAPPRDPKAPVETPAKKRRKRPARSAPKSTSSPAPEELPPTPPHPPLDTPPPQRDTPPDQPQAGA